MEQRKHTLNTQLVSYWVCPLSGLWILHFSPYFFLIWGSSKNLGPCSSLLFAILELLSAFLSCGRLLQKAICTLVCSAPWLSLRITSASSPKLLPSDTEEVAMCLGAVVHRSSHFRIFPFFPQWLTQDNVLRFCIHCKRRKKSGRLEGRPKMTYSTLILVKTLPAGPHFRQF